MTDAAAPPVTKARKGDLAVVYAREPAATYLDRPREPDAKGFALAVVLRTNRDGLVKAAERNHETARWPWVISCDAAVAVARADKIGDVAACVRDLPQLFATVADVKAALLAWTQVQ
jgi:hypothetical protein